MKIKKWLENKTFSDITYDGDTILSGSSIYFLLMTKYGEYTLLYDTLIDNDNLYNSYVTYITPKLVDLYNTLEIANNFDVLEDSKNTTTTTTYGKVNTNTNNYTKTNTGTVTTTNTGTVSNSGNDGGTSTNETSTYNTNTFENDSKTTISNTSSNTTTNNLTNLQTNNLSESNNGGSSDTLSGKDIVEIAETWSNNNLYNSYIDKKLELINTVSIVNFFVNNFINISAYFVGGAFDEI